MVFWKLLGGIVGALFSAAGGFLAGTKAVPKLIKAKDAFMDLIDECFHDGDDD